MKKLNKLEKENFTTYHFMLLGYANFKGIKKKLDRHLKYYRLEYVGKYNAKEITYDVADNMLSNSGIVLSKDRENDKVALKIRKISYLPGALKKPSKKYVLGEIDKEDQPKDFSLFIASAIENAFSSAFTVDLDSIVKRTMPKIEITNKADKYRIICGTGYRAEIYFENVEYKDVVSNVKVEKPSVTLHLPIGEQNEKENQEILKVIDRYINELALYNYSRVEIAQKLLTPNVSETVETENEEEE